MLEVIAKNEFVLFYDKSILEDWKEFIGLINKQCSYNVKDVVVLNTSYIAYKPIGLDSMKIFGAKKE
jgi:hypothetical protein